MPLNTVSLVSPVVTSISSVVPENLQRWTYNGLDVAAVTPTGMLDLRNSTTGTLPSRSNNGNLGTKIVFYSVDTVNPSWGFGLQGSRLVALTDPGTGNAFSVRTSIGGSDIIRFENNGNIGARFLDSINNNGAYIDMGPGGSGIIVANRTASHIPITVKGAASQTGSLQQWQNSAGTIFAEISGGGDLFMSSATRAFFGGSSSNAYLNVSTLGNPARQGIIVSGGPSQTGNLQEWQNNSATVLSSINPSGFFNTPRINFTGGTSTVSALALTDGTLSFESTAGQLFSISNSLTGTIFSVNDISGLPIIEATDLGIVKINELFGQTVIGSGTPTANTMLTSIARTATSIPIVVKGAASQTANLQEWQNTGGTVLSKIDKDGSFKGRLVYEINAQTGTTYSFALTDAASIVTLSSASAITASIPTDASVDFPIGSTITIIQTGAGQVTIQAVTAGTTTVSSNALTTNAPKLRGIGSSATLIKTSANNWYVIGDLY